MKNTFSKVISSITASALLVTTLGVGSVNAFNGSSINEFGKIVPSQPSLTFTGLNRAGNEFDTQKISIQYGPDRGSSEALSIEFTDSCIDKGIVKVSRDNSGADNGMYYGEYSWQNTRVDLDNESVVCGMALKYGDLTSDYEGGYYVVNNNVPIASISASATSIVVGESVTLNGSVNGGNNPIEYSWTKSQGFPEHGQQITVTPTQTTTYNLNVEDSDGDYGYAFVTITVNPAVVVPPVDDGNDEIVNPPVNPPVESKDGGSTTPVEDKSDAQKTDNKDQKNNKIIATSVKADDKDGEVLGTETSKNGLEVGDYFLIGAGVLALIGIIVGIVMFTRKKKSNQSLNQ